MPIRDALRRQDAIRALLLLKNEAVWTTPG
jgi:hypothetical protein